MMTYLKSWSMASIIKNGLQNLQASKLYSASRGPQEMWQSSLCLNQIHAT
jgi:hypothetical protein